ncbi:MAG: hypothetical protein EBS54_00460 [Betaproteobacteria bacterium]|nr:hypothetical protein [Betaproteobacteria bacterium]NBT05266.1 hypothetical protein [Betaproteobacteria bacterium]NCY07624.1 hypothetical protein [Betaproteobacteria bacterium]
MTRRKKSLSSWLLKLLLRHLPPKFCAQCIEEVQIALAGTDRRIGEYALSCNNPQALCFLIDIYPVLQELLARYPRHETLRFLDIGPAFGAAAGLISQMHRSDFLGPKLDVSVLDITDERRAFIELSYPLVRFIHSSIESVARTEQWDIVYCSNAIEHLAQPKAFIQKVLEHTKGFALFLSPYLEEEPLSLDHKSRIGEHDFKDFPVEAFRVFRSAAWPPTTGDTDRKQLLALVRGLSRT